MAIQHKQLLAARRKRHKKDKKGLILPSLSSSDEEINMEEVEAKLAKLIDQSMSWYIASDYLPALQRQGTMVIVTIQMRNHLLEFWATMTMTTVLTNKVKR